MTRNTLPNQSGEDEPDRSRRARIIAHMKSVAVGSVIGITLGSSAIVGYPATVTAMSGGSAEEAFTAGMKYADILKSCAPADRETVKVVLDIIDRSMESPFLLPEWEPGLSHIDYQYEKRKAIADSLGLTILDFRDDLKSLTTDAKRQAPDASEADRNDPDNLTLEDYFDTARRVYKTYGIELDIPTVNNSTYNYKAIDFSRLTDGQTAMVRKNIIEHISSMISMPAELYRDYFTNFKIIRYLDPDRGAGQYVPYDPFAIHVDVKASVRGGIIFHEAEHLKRFEACGIYDKTDPDYEALNPAGLYDGPDTTTDTMGLSEKSWEGYIARIGEGTVSIEQKNRVVGVTDYSLRNLDEDKASHFTMLLTGNGPRYSFFVEQNAPPALKHKSLLTLSNLIRDNEGDTGPALVQYLISQGFSYINP